MSGIERVETIGSTQATLIARARAGAPPGTTLVARTQSDGRGRVDHRWASPEGGLYLSRIVPLPRHAPSILPMAVALGIAERLEGRWRVAFRLRWPNDLVAVDSGRKLGGVLADSVGAVGEPRAVVGVGLNVAEPPDGLPPEIRAQAGTLSEWAGRPIAPVDCEPLVLDAIDAAAERLDRAGSTATALDGLRSRLDGIGRPIELDGIAVGRIVSLDPEGGLVTELAGRRSVHRAGSLRYLGGSTAPRAPSHR